MFRRKHKPHTSQEQEPELQEEKINELKAAIGHLSGCSLKFCTDPCLSRYLRARNWNVAKSKHMLEESLKWRTAYKPEEIHWLEVEHESETGKAYRGNFKDREGRTVLVMTPAKQNTTSHDNQLRHLVYLLENAILNLPEDQEQMVWLIDFTGWSLSNAVSMKTSKETLNILQNHYPERLGAAFVFNPPRIFEAFWKVIKVFVDPTTYQKIHFVYPKKPESMNLMEKHFDLDVLPADFGGNNKTEYDHEEYSALMMKDDTKLAAAWGSDEKPSHEARENPSTTAAPEPSLVPAQVS
ncbi:phosphatidylinositol transfer protein PDR16-like isoform X2 [Iris pallida]|uniref:Phosphatidylinositol transfer protein PDR16-like isoform X2 n=2 Tax=Iris pallida TaxID=29817 RepID=A0AAX6HS91_IRIPA|nr:phosphatidylinositol transfer protein PDR16-like isoform X2 [Iris pallida]KAJ6843936.1 phosphatidylinositol transfer protein PDR16-like isoform X2 [Iris pallida]